MTHGHVSVILGQVTHGYFHARLDQIHLAVCLGYYIIHSCICGIIYVQSFKAKCDMSGKPVLHYTRFDIVSMQDYSKE